MFFRKSSDKFTQNIVELENQIKDKDLKISLIKSEVNEICMIMGKNKAHDYDGIESIDDIILYLKSIKNSLPTKNISQKYITQ